MFKNFIKGSKQLSSTFRWGYHKKSKNILLYGLTSLTTIVTIIGFKDKIKNLLENHLLTPVHAFSLFTEPSADFTTYPFRTDEMLWKIPTREEQLNLLKEQENKIFDICIIGDGLLSASLAYEASLRGYSVCLLSKNDFISHQDTFHLNSNFLFHHVLEGNSNNSFLKSNHLTPTISFCNLNNNICESYSTLYSSLKDKIEKRNQLFKIAPHLMREFRMTEIFTNKNKFNYNKQLTQLLSYEYFIYGKHLWMEDLILKNRNECEGSFSILRNKFMERTNLMNTNKDDLFIEFKDIRNIYRCLTYYDSGILNLNRFITSLALTNASIKNSISLNYIDIKQINNNHIIFKDYLNNNNEYNVKFKHLVYKLEDNDINNNKLLKEEYQFTLPSISNYCIITPYGNFIPHYNYSILSLPSEHLNKLNGILKIANFTTNNIYSQSKVKYNDNQLKIFKNISSLFNKDNNNNNGMILGYIDTTKDYYSSQIILNLLFKEKEQKEFIYEPIIGSQNFVHYLTQTMKTKYPFLHDDIIRYLKFNYGDCCLNVLKRGVSQNNDNISYKLLNQIWEDLPYIESEVYYLIENEMCCKALDIIIRCQMYKYDPFKILVENEKLLKLMKNKLNWNEERYQLEKNEITTFLTQYLTDDMKRELEISTLSL
ncbi:hypothetical protein ABK040_006741 [Willaertia magna]